MKRLYPLLLLSLLFIGCSDKHDDQPNSPAVQLYELHYTTIDEKVVELYRDDFGADIVSNTYNDGVGVIAFDAPITTIGERVFYNCSTLESITIPSSVTSIGSEAFYRCDCLKAFNGKYTTPDGRALIIDETLCYIAPSGLTDYTIPSDVKTLGSLSFAYCTELVTVKIPSSVTAIGSEAFYACTSIEGVTLPESVVSLGELSFAECDHLSEVYVQQSTPPTGGDDMFDGNAADRKIYVPIGYGSTYKMANGWKEYSTSIEEYDFNPVPDVVIKEATVAEFIAAEVGDATIYELTGVIQNIQNVEYGNFDLVDATGSVYIYGLTDESGEKVFEALGLKEGDTVTLRGTRSAYKDTPEVKGAIYVSHVACPVPSEQTNYEIWYTSSDGKVVEPYRSEAFDANIISNIYENGKGVITFDGEVTTIDNYAFYGCRLLTSVTLPSSVTTLGFQIFYDCDGITSITIPESVTTIEGGAFTGCDNLSEFKGKYATKDGHCLIIGNTLHSFVSVGVDTYVVPAGVTRIEDYAFYDTAISDVTFPDGLTYIGVSTFAYCSDIEALTLPSSITHISSAAFCQCSSLTSITIPEYVEFIGDRAFLSCESLLEIYSKPTTPPTGDDYMFEGNSADRKIYVPVQSYSAYVSKDHWRDYADYIVGYDFEKGEVAPEGQRNNEIWYTSTDGNIVTPYRSNVFGATIVSNTYEDGKGVITFDGAVTTIGGYTFYNCDSLTSVTIPDSVTTIETGAFASCDSLKEFKGEYATDNGRCLIVDNTLIAYANKSGTEYTIPDSVTTIGGSAFSDCNSLTSVTIPDSVTTIGDKAFYNCDSLTSITIPDSVTTIGYWAFMNCISLTSVTIGDSVTTIGREAFYSCRSLTSVYCKATTPPRIGIDVFNYNANSRKIYVPTASVNDYKTANGWRGYANYIVGYDFEKGEVAPEGQRNNEIWYTSSGGNIVTPYTSNVFGATIVSNTYENGKGIITFDGAVTTIGDSAFSGCDSLTSITIPDSVTTIGDWAFGYCYGLTSITIPDSVTTIGDYAFKECDSLTSVTIPDSVTTIGDGAFWDCTSLTSITIPDSVTTIGDDVFSCCNSLTSVTIGDSVTTIGDYAFYDCSSLTSVTIPDSVTTIGEWAFSDCNSLTSVTIPDSVTTIGDYAFWSCKSLTSVNIGDSVTTIGGYAFYKCASLTSVYCKATTPPSIGDYVFYDNANSRKIYVPTASVNDYKTADGWRGYAYYIVGYDF